MRGIEIGLVFTNVRFDGFLGGSLEGEISKDGKTDAVSLGKAEEASKACIAASFLLGTFGLSEEMEVS